MQINDKLSLVIPLRYDGDKVTIWGYHTPISTEVFEANFITLAATKATLTSKGIQFLMGSGPRIAALTLLNEARKDAQERGDVDAEGNPSDRSARALLAEFKRLTTLVAPGPDGWSPIPVDTAIAQGIIDQEDWKEAESAITFFTCHYALATRAERKAIIPATASVLMGESTSLPLTEYIRSLPTLTKEEPTEAKGESSVPS